MVHDPDQAPHEAAEVSMGKAGSNSTLDRKPASHCGGRRHQALGTLCVVCIFKIHPSVGGFPGGSDGKESACNAGDLGSIPVSGRSPGGGIGYPLQDSCLENSMDRGVWWAAVHGVTKSRTYLSD